MVRSWKRPVVLGAVMFALAASQVAACSICGLNLALQPTLRQEAAASTARIIVLGVPQDRTMRITEVLRRDDALGDKNTIDLPRPVLNPDGAKFLVYCDVFKDKLDPFRGVPLKSTAAMEYVRKVVAMDQRDTTANLQFFFGYLDHADTELNRDAFMEFMKSSDQDLVKVAPKLSADKLRDWLKDPRTPPERLSIYALLLGAGGRPEDAGFLERMLADNDERTAKAYGGLLAGYMHLRPREGWRLAVDALRDSKKPLDLRLGVVSTLRFWHTAQPRESRDDLLRCFAVVLTQADLADLAVEELRKWRMYDMTRDILGLYGRKGYEAPLMQRAIIRYALTCDDADSRTFLQDRRRAEPDVVRDVEEEVRLEK
jgi:hypothetical protein